MLSLLKKNNQASPEQAEWFAKKTMHVIYDDLKARKEFITTITAFYNAELMCCIIKLGFDKNYVVGEEYLYFLLDYNTKQMERAGNDFEQTISHVSQSVAWIKNNKVHQFHSDNLVLSYLTNKLK